MNSDAFSESAVGFATFFLNRCNRSGIIRANPIGGINQTGKWLINARFNKKGLIERIKKIEKYKDQITVENRDALDLVRCLSNTPHMDKYFIYLDPPYYNFGQELYLNAYRHNDHIALSDFLKVKSNLNWVMTYDNHQAIRDMYSFCRVIDFNLNYFAHKPRQGCELLILPWQIQLPSMHVQPHYGLEQLKVSVNF